ncbi:MAG: DNA polymerase III subunit alpha [Dethiobacter sp.]|jgi:DNA polymerase-3 subunit alpha|nr:DNA polymerase III subunit alpha [Dethiobacter sp.]
MENSKENSKFVHLHCHSEYSLLDGASRIRDMIGRAKVLGMPALAITDHGTMYGVIDFYKEAKKAGIKPLIGCEVYVSPRRRTDRDPRIDSKQHHLVLLARDQEGYLNLMELVSRGFSEGFYYKPRVDHELLLRHNRGLTALSACIAGEIPQALLENRLQDALSLIAFYKQTFGEEYFFLELQDHGLPEQKMINEAVVRLARETKTPLVVTNDLHYINKSDAEAHDVLLCIQTAKTVEDEKRMRFSTSEFYLKTAAEMSALFTKSGIDPTAMAEAMSNTLVIADSCNLDFEFGNTHLPVYEIPAGYDENSYLREVCLQGLKNRFEQDVSDDIANRLDFELSVIAQMGYASYFLIVWDFIRYAHENGIPVGPGRGSAAGSLAAYCLKITDIDPLRYGLLFERFLNPERITMPDIDIDFCYEKRGQVIEYVIQKYGEENVAQIITFGTMAAKAAVRDVGRALNLPYADVDRIAKMIPAELNISIEDALQKSSELQELYKNDEKVTRLIDLSLALEGLPRHASTHAAGVVISREPLVRYVPLQKSGEDGMVTQFSMGILEELGLLKMDFLGLRTLTIMQEVIRLTEEPDGSKINLSQLPLDDGPTYHLLSQGDTAGVFQLESSGMRSILRDLKPSVFEDIIAVVALYRPGPMEQIPVFIQSKHGQIPINYLHASLEPILKETYGVMVYQEQIMQVAASMAGFSLGEADLLRRAIGKKKLETLNEQREVFVRGCVGNGHPKKMADELYDLIVKFASYGFNKSHAAAYALVAYQTAYLKANYPTQFMAALMTGVMSNTDKVAAYIADSKRAGIEVLSPHINQSEANFAVSAEKSIRFGLAAVKNVGQGAIESILQARGKNGDFTSLRDFCSRVDLRSCNKKVMENLIKCGAFDCLGANRSQLLAVLDETVSAAQTEHRERQNGQMSMFEIVEEDSEWVKARDDLPNLPELSSRERLAMEKEALGLYISGHPLQEYGPVLNRLTTLIQSSDLAEMGDNEDVQLAGMIISVKHITTKKGKQMAFFQLEDLAGAVEVVVFPEVYEKVRLCLTSDSVVAVNGRTSRKEEEEVKIMAEMIFPLPREAKEVVIRCEDAAMSELLQLRDILTGSRGLVPVYIYFPAEHKNVLTSEDFWLSEDPVKLEEIKELFGTNSVSMNTLDKSATGREN